MFLKLLDKIRYPSEQRIQILSHQRSGTYWLRWCLEYNLQTSKLFNSPERLLFEAVSKDIVTLEYHQKNASKELIEKLDTFFQVKNRDLYLKYLSRYK